jgi:hypothetical protein
MDIKEYKEYKIKEMKAISQNIEEELSKLSEYSSRITTSFFLSGGENFLNVKHLENWECERLLDTINNLIKLNNELWTIGKCVQELNNVKDK